MKISNIIRFDNCFVDHVIPQTQIPLGVRDTPTEATPKENDLVGIQL